MIYALNILLWFQLSNTDCLSFAQKFIDLGTVKKGKVVKLTYAYKNELNSNVIILKATGSCGCTVVSWPKKPISPGEIGTITVKYYAPKTNLGYQHKTVTLTTNCAESPIYLTFRANVIL